MFYFAYSIIYLWFICNFVKMSLSYVAPKVWNNQTLAERCNFIAMFYRIHELQWLYHSSVFYILIKSFIVQMFYIWLYVFVRLTHFQ